MAGKIRKAVFPVAGLGTRFLPATKAMPKEMLPVVDRPVIQWVVDEAREAGIEHLIFVTGRNKGVIEDHFDKQLELEQTLRERGRLDDLALLQADLPAAGQVSFTRQQSPLGLGHAVWCARELVGNEPFALLLPDMLADGEPGCLKRMMKVYEETGGNLIAVEEIAPEHAERYGIVGAGEHKNGCFEITAMVEKPPRGAAPSNLMIMGRYILQPEIFAHLEAQTPGSGGEIQLTDAMVALHREQAFHGHVFDGRTFDCGDKVGFLLANIAYAVKRDDLRDRFRVGIAELMADMTARRDPRPGGEAGEAGEKSKAAPVSDAPPKAQNGKQPAAKKPAKRSGTDGTAARHGRAMH